MLSEIWDAILPVDLGYSTAHNVDLLCGSLRGGLRAPFGTQNPSDIQKRIHLGFQYCTYSGSRIQKGRGLYLLDAPRRLGYGQFSHG